MPRPFRFGVSVRHAPDGGAWKALARKAEDLGFDILLTADHLLELFPPLTGLAMAADATKRLRVGTLVLNNDFRHPAMLAREAATIDLLTGGRFELGIGAGHMKQEYDSAGLRFDEARVRVDRLEESVHVLKRLLAGEELTFKGDQYQLEGHRCFPRPVQSPVPVLIGGNGRRVLELAAREAQIVGFTGFFPSPDGTSTELTHFSESGLRRRLDVVHAAAAERMAELELNCLVQNVVVTNSPREEAAQIASRRAGLTAEDLMGNPFLFIGSVNQICDDIVRRREELGVSYYAVFEPAMEALAPVIARLGAP